MLCKRFFPAFPPLPILVDQVKEQTEIDPGVMDDLTVSVSVNGTGFGNLQYNEVRELVANATGIPLDQIDEKITAVAAPFYTDDTAQDVGAVAQTFIQRYGWIAAIIGGALLLILLIVFLIVRRVRKKRRERERLAAQPSDTLVIPDVRDEEEDLNILSMQNERSRELRESIRDFAEDNPEISAQMLRSWLNGGESDAANTN